MESADQTAPIDNRGEMISQGAIEANIQRPPTVSQRRPILGQRQLRLARSRRAGNAQAIRRKIQLPRPVCQAAGNPRH
jgi:hypothetical protein